jgi:adenylate kinase family enzyme
VLTRAISLIGPPAAGKSALALRLADNTGYAAFRLREHVPQALLAAAAADATAARIGWVDDFTAMTSIHGFVERVTRDRETHTVVLDSFPGTETQVRLYLFLMRQLAPGCLLAAAELTAPEFVLRQRAGARRVCGYCERDPLCDPRLPAVPSESDPRRCARCDHLLGTRHGDDPSVYRVRMRRYRELSDGIRRAFEHAGIPVPLLVSDGTPDHTAGQFAALFTPEESP